MVREKYLLAPSEEEYNIEATKDTSMGQAQLIRKILRNKVESFKGILCFVELYTNFLICHFWPLSPYFYLLYLYAVNN